MKILDEISERLQEGSQEEVKAKVEKALEEEIEAEKILNEGLLKGMSIIGKKFKENEVFVPEVLVSARAMNGGMEILKPKLVEDGVESTGTVVLGTVKDDLHDIGKNLVRMMLEGAGFEIFDLGTDVSPEEFVEKIIEEKPDIVGLSALLTTTMENIGEVIEVLEEEGLREEVFVMVGGAPITDDFAKEVGADAYASDASRAAEVAEKAVS